MERNNNLDSINEYFVVIDGYSNYLASNFGNIYNRIKNQFCHQSLLLAEHSKKYYARVHVVSDSGIRGSVGVARLVLMGFQPLTDYSNIEAHHIDENTLNNSLYNLKWVTHLENCIEHYKMSHKDEEYPYNENAVYEICELLSQSKSYDEISKKVFGKGLNTTTASYISAIRKGNIRKEISSKFKFPEKMRNYVLFSDDILTEFYKLLLAGFSYTEILNLTENILWGKNNYSSDQVLRVLKKLKSKNRFTRITQNAI